MKRAATYGLIAVLAAALIGAGALGAAWLAGTTDGARWLMGAVSRHTPLTISARTIEGRLADRLRLGGVRMTLPPVEVAIESIDFRWRPLLLLSGTVATKELTLTGVLIRDNTPGEKPPDLAWPRVSGIAGLFEGEIERLQVNGLTYRRLDGQPVNVTTVSSSAAWRNAVLSLSDFAAVAPTGRVAGSIAADFSRPSLRFDLAVTPVEPIAGMDTLTIQARLLPGRNPEQLAGGFTVAGASGNVKRLELAGEAGMTRQAFNLKQLRLTIPGRRGTVAGGGTVTLTAGEPLVELQLKAAGLDLTPEIKVATDLSGTLTLTGTPEQYRGEFTIVNTGKGWRTARLSGAYQGNGTGVKLSPLTGALLAGSVQGSLDIRWREEFSLEGTIRGRNLNPAGISPDWGGVVNFDLTGSGAWPRQAPFRGEVSGSLLESRMHGQALTGELQANLSSGELHVGRLLLRGKGFDISAAGDLNKRLAFDAQVDDLGRLIPQAAGQLRADGWVRWYDGRLYGSVTGRGRNLAGGGMRVAVANVTARLGEGKEYPVHVAATLQRVAYGRFQADAVHLDADGTILRHTVDAALRSGSAEVQIGISGAYDRGSWQGEIIRFSGRDGIGPWSIGGPALLSITAGKITLDPLVMIGEKSERVEIAGELRSEPSEGVVRAVWSGLNLARMNPWLKGVRVTGTSAGKGSLRFPEGETPAFAGNADAQGTVAAEEYGRFVEHGSLSLEGNERLMRAGVEFRLAGGGVLTGTISSPGPAVLAIPKTAELTAEWAGIDVASFRRWLPGEIGLEGRVAGRVGGKLLPGERLDLDGRVSLAQGKIRWQREGDALDADLQRAEVSGRWQGTIGASAAEIRAGVLAVAGRADAAGIVTVDGRQIRLEQVSLSIDGNERGMHAAIGLSPAGGGVFKGVVSSPGPAVLALPKMAELTAEWTGIDMALLRPWLPKEIGLEGLLAGRVGGKLLPGERLDLVGRISLAQGKIRWQREGDALDADLQTAELSGHWQGAIGASGAAIRPGVLAVAGRAGATGIVTVASRQIRIEQVSLSIDGNERGMHADIDLSLTGGGSLKGRFSSAKPAGLAIPGEGEWNLEWAGIDLLLFRPWLPRTVNLEGRLAGRATGKLFPEQRFEMKGDSALSGGKVSWLRPEGEMNAGLHSASVTWAWRGEVLSGTAALTLAEYGKAEGMFQLPIPARLPTGLDRKGALQVSLTGRVREKGALASLFPGFIQESRGELDADLQVNGTWEEPKIEGSMKLDGAGAYLPSAGIHVKDIQFAMRLEKDLIRIDSFRAASGPGHIEGTALIRFKGRQVADYRGSISGERFQTVYLPELQILSTPRLTFEGTPEKLAIRGEVHLPELLIFGPPTRSVVLPSRDVILEGMPKPAEKHFPLVLDVQVRLIIGEKVMVKAEGIDAQLGGSMDLVFRSLDRITSKGEIRVVKGRYRAFGADLEIVRGRLFYAGGPINQPTLDILALRTIGDVRAGITAGGLLRAPVIKLYSEPAMPDVDILAYILFGHPFGTSNSLEQAGMMAQVASTLLSGGQSVSLQEQIRDRLGLSTLELQSGEASGRMGYKPIQSTPPGIAPVNPAGGVSQTMLTVGKYLTPQLYFSYGRSLFTGGNLFRLRYDIFKQWQIETQTGSESGVDIYYKINFD